MMSAKELINMMIPCKIHKIVDYAESQMYGYSYDAYPSGYEIKCELIKMFNDREIDIMFTSNGYPIVVYSNWNVACKIVRR